MENQNQWGWETPESSPTQEQPISNWGETSPSDDNPTPISWEDSPNSNSNNQQAPVENSTEHLNVWDNTSSSVDNSPETNVQISSIPLYLGEFDRFNFKNSIYFVKNNPLVNKEIDSLEKTPISNENNFIYDINPKGDSHLGEIIKNIWEIIKQKNLKIDNIQLVILPPNKSIEKLFNSSPNNYFIYSISSDNIPGEILLDLSQINGPNIPILKTIPNIFSIFPAFGNFKITPNQNQENQILLLGSVSQQNG